MLNANRQFSRAPAGRVKDGVGNRGRHPDDCNVTQTFDTERVNLRILFVYKDGFQRSAIPIPPTIPPVHWLCAKRGLTMRPAPLCSNAAPHVYRREVRVDRNFNEDRSDRVHREALRRFRLAPRRRFRFERA